MGVAYFRGVDDTPKLLGDRIKKRREELGMKPADLARAAGCSISAVMQWESNKTKNLKLDNLFKIADALGVEARWLGTGEGVKLKLIETGEADAIKHLRDALPEWRSYVMSLARVKDPRRQRLFLDVLREPSTDEKVELAFWPNGTKKK